MKPTFRKGDRVISTKRSKNLFIGRFPQRGIVTSNQKNTETVRVLREGIKNTHTFWHGFWELDK